MWPRIFEVELADGAELRGSLAQCQKHAMGPADTAFTQKLLSSGAIEIL